MEDRKTDIEGIPGGSDPFRLDDEVEFANPGTEGGQDG
jgi:hypothetical protein